MEILKVFSASQSEVARRMEESCGQKHKELGSGGHGFLTRSGITHDEHPLSLGKTSVWNQFFQVKLLSLTRLFFSLCLSYYFIPSFPSHHLAQLEDVDNYKGYFSLIELKSLTAADEVLMH